MPKHILAIDQGTTSTRAVVYDDQGRSLGSASLEFTQFFPSPDHVEHDLDEIWRTVETVVPKALAAARVTGDQIHAIGITNQRETVALWDRATGKPIARAIVWQDRRTAQFCRDHRADEPWLHERTGLVLDPYFSATKLNWMLDNVNGARSEAEAGRLAFGTIDTFLIWRLTAGIHATDVSNASRTLLFNLKSARWDDELCRYFHVPSGILPEVRASASNFGTTKGLSFLPDGIPIAGVAGDQQAALAGQCCFRAGENKCTYGTGAFYLVHTGDQPTFSKNGLITTMAATLSEQPQYALEGSVFIAGAAVQWLRDGLKLFDKAADIEALASQSKGDPNLIFVPGLVGLGAPHWEPNAKGVILGITRGTTKADLARATLEGVALQVADLIVAANKDTGKPIAELRVDGGMARNEWFLQEQADILGVPVLQASETESTALGAALLAGLATGVWSSPEEFRALAGSANRFEPQRSADDRESQVQAWRRAVHAVVGFYKNQERVS